MEPPPFKEESEKDCKNKEVIVKYCDMEEEMKIEAIEHIIQGIDKCLGDDGIEFQAAAKFIKENMDRQFGASWHCIIGDGFSYEVTRFASSSLILYYAKSFVVLLFKC